MRLPHPSNDNLCFLADDAKELLSLIGAEAEQGEAELIREYCRMGLPPVTSRPAIAAMFGYNEGFVRSLLKQQRRHYRKFEIPKGREMREIYAPRVGLKTIQKWLGTHFQNSWTTHEAVYGFVPGRSHLAAAACHLGSEWVASIDIENFFPSTDVSKVRSAVERLGYHDDFSKDALVKLTCHKMGLTQGAPSSPVISNIVLHDLDNKLAEFAVSAGFVYTRYADDLVMSGSAGNPDTAVAKMRELTVADGWKVAERKTSIDRAPNRRKVHGLLVHGDRIRLTKGYRNRIRAYRYLLDKNKVRQDDVAKLLGHVEFADSVDRFNDSYSTALGKTSQVIRDKLTNSASSSAISQHPDGKPRKEEWKANIGVQSPPEPKPVKPTEKEGEQK